MILQREVGDDPRPHRQAGSQEQPLGKSQMQPGALSIARHPEADGRAGNAEPKDNHEKDPQTDHQERRLPCKIPVAGVECAADHQVDFRKRQKYRPRHDTEHQRGNREDYREFAGARSAVDAVATADMSCLPMVSRDARAIRPADLTAPHVPGCRLDVSSMATLWRKRKPWGD
jgi:hypothetical protein